MITKGDDYPLHQTADPIAYSGTDRNFYDRYFFNGYAADGELFFGTALGVYPHLNIMDASFAVRIGDVQHNLHASRHLNMERLDTQVGPISIEVVEPLRRLRIRVDDPDHGVAADILFEGRIAPIEEPRVTRRNGPRTYMDITRMTQMGSYTGWIRIGDRRIDFAGRAVTGTRDRSWGTRPVGLPDPQPSILARPPQFHWIWIPASFADRVMLFYVNEDAAGERWNYGMTLVPDGGAPEHYEGARLDIRFAPGTRWPEGASLAFADHAGGRYRVEVTPEARFFMMGLGYANPEWLHGIDKGPLAVGYDVVRAGDVTACRPPHNYVQAFARLALTTPDGTTHHGVGVLESLSIGDHAPLGFTGLYDAA